MRIIVCCLLLVVGCSTKSNPNACSVASDCDSGLVCRGGQCIAEACTGGSDCDAAAPYCVATLCAAQCTDDMQCPGFGGAAGDTFCVGGGCVECKVNSDCPATASVCDTGTCRGCERPDECASGACAADGTCVEEADISFVSSGGGSNAACTRAEPCTLARALTLSHETIELLPGTYVSSAKTTITGKRTLVGAGAQTIVTSSVPGAIFGVDPSADATFDSFQISGASTNNAILGIAIDAQLPSGARTITVKHMRLEQNAHAGLRAANSTITVLDTELSANGTAAAQFTDSTATFDRCTIANHTDEGLSFDGGYYTVTNSFIVRNATGINVFGFSNQPSHFEFNTFADNSGQPIACSDQQPVVTNSILARNGMTPTGCALSSNLMQADVTGLQFVSPDLAPYDYHLGSGSMAIDMAGGSTIDHDVDGDHRPQGGGFDMGADERQ